MDGAARFNQRDAIATILITAINIVAGFLIGVFQLDIPFREALKTYTVLTVGDGLVTMIPSLLVSMAGGIVVTRASSDATLSVDVGRQVLSRRRPLIIAAGVMLALAAIPGLPKFSFFLLAAGAGLSGLARSEIRGRAGTGDRRRSAQRRVKKSRRKDSVEDLLKLDELSLEVGYGLVPLVDQNQGGQLLARVTSPAAKSGAAAGLHRSPDSYHGQRSPEAQGVCHRVARRGDGPLGTSSGQSCWPSAQKALRARLPGVATKEPAFGAAAVWIPAALQNQALASGYAVVDQTSVLATHLAEVVKQHAHELLTRQETKRLLDRLAESHPKLVEELVPKDSESGRSAENSATAIARAGFRSRSIDDSRDTARRRAGATRIRCCWSKSRARRWAARWCVRCYQKSEACAWSRWIARSKTNWAAPSVHNHKPRRPVGMQPPFARRILDGLRKLAGEQVAVASPVLLCATPARYHLKRLLEPFLPKVVVLSPLEVPPVVEVQSLGVLR